MLQLLIALLLVQPTPGPGDGGPKFGLPDKASGPMPVTDKDLRPQKAPDCRNEAEIQRAVEQVNNGEAGECFIRDMKRLSRR